MAAQNGDSRAVLDNGDVADGGSAESSLASAFCVLLVGVGTRGRRARYRSWARSAWLGCVTGLSDTVMS